MSTKLKLYLGRKVIESLHKSTKYSPSQLQPLIHVGNSKTGSKIELNLPLHILENQLGITNINEILKIEPDEIIKNISLIKDRANRNIAFEIDRNIFMKDVLENCAQSDLNFNPKTIVIDYSSPNIAKPFHLGHLRSTIIGNFIANLNIFLKNKVTRINYLGDWGTQFGFIKVGVDDLKLAEDDIKKNPLQLLYQSYVHANKLGENDPKILEKAKEEFKKLERGLPEDIKYWKDYMTYTKNELESTYKRLGVTFDEYNYESMYSSKEIESIVKHLRKKNIIEKERDGNEVVKINDRKISLVKSDGTTLYLTRDIAAAIDRFNKYKFDKMFYVVENGQSDHFNALKSIIHKMDYPWSDRLKHVKFGRIKGMSTRKGTAVFLKDILDECRERTVQRQIQSPNTKGSIEETSDILGVSCVIINDLKQRRQKDYEFDWERVLQVQGDTGIRLQYTHSRLHSLQLNSGAVIATQCIPELLDGNEVTILLKEMARFHDVLYNSNEQLEACILVNYLFHLCNHINRALKVLQVKGQPTEIASQRLLLFSTAKEVLKNGMSIVGLQPLNQM